MNRRWPESQLNAAPIAAQDASIPSLPGFVACSVSQIPHPTLQIWHTIYQAAFRQAVVDMLIDTQPTAYQRLVYRICLN
jgi:hypothetical protein